MIREYQDHGCTVREETAPDGFVIIDEYTPCSSVTPWDGYGISHQREYSRVLERAGVAVARLVTTRTINHPIGTGPHGRVRFGDNMTPGLYRLAVPAAQESAARSALAAHRAEIEEWLKDPSRPMPEACRG